MSDIGSESETRKPLLSELPFANIVKLRQQRLVTPQDRTVTLTLDGITATIPLTLRVFQKGGNFSFFICNCGRPCRRLYASRGQLRCPQCTPHRYPNYASEAHLAGVIQRLEERVSCPARAIRRDKVKRRLRAAKARLREMRLKKLGVTP